MFLLFQSDFMEDRYEKENAATGTVRTNKVGSECTFYICTREEWAAMSEDEQDKALMEALYESGILDVYPNV